MGEGQKKLTEDANKIFSFPTMQGQDVDRLSNMCMKLMYVLAPSLGLKSAVDVAGIVSVIVAMEHAKLVESRKTNEKLEALLIEVQLLNQKERAS